MANLKDIAQLAAQRRATHRGQPNVYAGNADMIDIYWMIGDLAEATMVALGKQPAQVSSAIRKAKTTKVKVRTKSRKR